MSNHKKEKVMPKGMGQLVEMFNLFLDFNCTGLLCFMSDEPLPSTEELSQMIVFASRRGAEDAGRVQGGIVLPYAQGVLERAEMIERMVEKFGGMENIRQSFAFFRELENEMCGRMIGRINRYELLRDLSSVGTSKFPSVGSVAFNYHLRSTGLGEKRRIALEQVAKDIYFKSRLIGVKKERAA